MSAPFQALDQEVRNRALKNFDRVSFIEAGAGTGKTELLTDKYVSLVKEGRAKPIEIVAVTFTEKAASELKERIRARLTKLGALPATEDLERAPIMTLHAFAGSLLRERPLEVGLDPQFKTMDAISSVLFLERAYREWFPEALESSGEALYTFLGCGWSLDKVRTVVFDAYRYRDLLHALPPPHPSPDIEAFFRRAYDTIRSLAEIAEKSCTSEVDDGLLTVRRLKEEFSQLDLEPSAAKERYFLTRFSLSSTSGNQKAWSPPTSLKSQKEKLKALKNEATSLIDSLRGSLIRSLLSFANRFVAHTEELKRKEGLVDFDDLLFLARDLVRDHPEVADDFRKKYRYFLIDEFQDTDPVQIELLWWLASSDHGAAHWKELTPKPGRLFVVGDPKQSIYRFRRADIASYQAAVGEIARTGDRFVIQQNFRSSAPLIDWINDIFAPILGTTYEPLLADPRHITRPRRSAVVCLDPPDYPEEPSARELREDEAAAITAYLAHILRSTEPRVFDQGVLRPALPGDIAVLFPTTTEIDLFEESLRRASLPFSLEGGKLFFGRNEIHAVLAALEAIDSPTDSVAVTAALRSVLFGLSDQDLFGLIERSDPFDYRKVDPLSLAEPARSAYKILRELHAKRYDLLPSSLIGALFEATVAVPITLARRHGEQAAANLEKLLGLARALERTEPMTLRRFVRWVRERSNDPASQTESPVSMGESDRIRLLTIHRAKGLEFPIVVIANLGSKGSNRDSVIARRLEGEIAFGYGSEDARFGTSNFETLRAQEKIARAEEQRRLLYVAATRARDLLVIPRFYGRSPTGLWTILNEGWEKGVSRVESETFSSLVEANVSAQRKIEIEKGEAPSLIEAESLFLESHERRLARSVRGLPIRTPSDLAHDDEVQRKPALLSKGLPGLAFGSLVHEVLERVDLFHPETLDKLCRYACAEAGYPNAAPEIEALCRAVLSHPLMERARKAKRIFRELLFSWFTKDPDELFNGAIDLAFEESGGWILVDYKTDRIDVSEMPERVKHYTPQISLYSRAFTAVTGARVAEAALFFVRIGEVVRIAEV